MVRGARISILLCYDRRHVQPRDRVSEAPGWDPCLTFMGFALLAGVVWSAVMDGIHLYGDVISPPTPAFQWRFLFFESIVAATLFVLSSCRGVYQPYEGF